MSYNKSYTNDNNKTIIVTSFYPMYTIAANIILDISDFEVMNLTASNTGCLHDYQITTADMVKLSHADSFIINGDGMENFIEKAINAYKDLNIINASIGIKEKHEEIFELESYEDSHEENHEEIYGEIHSAENEEDILDLEKNEHSHHHDHEENSHYWVSISLYIEQVKNVLNELCELYPEYEEKFIVNAKNYIDKLEIIKEELHDIVDNSDSNKNIVTFHEAFEYFAEELGLNIVAVIEREPGTYPSARDVAEIIDEVRNKDVKAIFVEPQYSRSAADTIARETGIKVYNLDPIVTGELSKDAYIDIMNQNIETLKEALN